MAFIWFGTLFYTLQVTGAVIWIPIIISIAVAFSGMIVNAFIFGRKWEQKADKESVIHRPEYEKDMQSINNDLDDFAKEIDENRKRLEQHETVYHSIDKKLGILLNEVGHIKKNCDKQTCKK